MGKTIRYLFQNYGVILTLSTARDGNTDTDPATQMNLSFNSNKKKHLSS
jgi:hypothetical protein